MKPVPDSGDRPVQFGARLQDIDHWKERAEQAEARLAAYETASGQHNARLAETVDAHFVEEAIQAKHRIFKLEERLAALTAALERVEAFPCGHHDHGDDGGIIYFCPWCEADVLREEGQPIPIIPHTANCPR